MFNQAQMNYGAPNGQFQYGGMPANTMVKFNNTLTPEQINRLQAKGAQFSLALTEEEALRGVCNHRNAEGTGDSLVFDPVTGKAQCTICGHTFRPVENTDNVGEDIKEDVDRIIDILQTIKLMYIDLPAEVSIEYFKIIPLLQKVPQLFEFAAKNMSKHDCTLWQYNNQNMGAVAMFQNLNNLFGGMNGMAYQQQPMMMNQPYNMAPAGYPQANAFGYPGASQQQYVAGTNPAFAYQPNQQPTPVAPSVAAPTAPAADATVSQTVTV